MKKIYKYTSLLFSILTIIGAIYVFINHGQVSAGYACVPMVFSIASLALYRKQ